MKTPISSDLDFDTFKKLRNFQNKLTKKKNRNIIKSLLAFIARHKLGFIISISIILLITILLGAVAYPLYVKNFVSKSNEIYLEIQKKKDADLQKTFDGALALQTITTDDLNKLKIKTEEFKSDIDASCSKLPLAIFSVQNLSDLLKNYCKDLKSSDLYIFELLQAEVMIGTVQNYYITMSDATSRAVAFKEISQKYKSATTSTKDTIFTLKFSNTNLIELQKNTAIIIDKISDAYNQLSLKPISSTSTSDNSNVDDKYKKTLSDIAKPWSESISGYVDKVTTDIRTNTEISSRQFLDEYNKLSPLNSNNLEPVNKLIKPTQFLK